MTQGRMVKAYKALLEIGQQRLPSTISYKLFKLRRQLQPAWDFQIERETQIFEMYPPVQQEDRKFFKFESPEAKQDFEEAFKELNDMEPEIPFDPINVPLLPEMRLSGNDLETLEDFVFFTSDEPGNA